jgi:four helix bundle protein
VGIASRQVVETHVSRYRQEASRFGFENLEVYKAARAFRTRIYKLAQILPAAEKFGLAQQMRRAAVSATNNIAEGYGLHHWQENTHFCRHSRGSLMELLNGYISYPQRQKAYEA